MRKRMALLSGFTVAILLAFSTTGVATTLTFNNTVGPTNAGLYSGTISPATGGLSKIDMVCDDLFDTIHAGQSWTITTPFITLAAIVGAPGNNAGQMFTSATQGLSIVQAYETAMFLSGEIFTSPQSDWPSLNQELWAIFDPGATLTASEQTDLTNAIAAAEAEPMSFFASYVVLTPNPLMQNGKTPQEMITKTAVPETSSAMLLLLGLAGVALFGRKLRLA